MRRVVIALLGVALASASAASGHARAANDTIDSAFAAFWGADDVRGAEKAAQRIVESGAEFDAVWSRLRAGRTYEKEATGVQQMPTTVGGTRLDNIVDIPAEYDPSKKWALRVQLHGGVGRPAPVAGDREGRPLADNRIPGQSQIYLHPRAWAGSEWWRANQVDNIFKLIDAVKRKYNVDESHVYITGISDGGTGVYYLAMRAATMWAACMPLNGHPLVLANPSVGADGELFVTNLANCPMYIVNGGRDPLYPAASVAPLIKMMKQASVGLEFHVHPEAGHNTSWWPVERPLYEKYLAANPRAAYAERLSWETERTDRYNRISWLTIDALGKRPSDVSLEDVNSFEEEPGVKTPLYHRGRPSGRVDITRRGNNFDAKTRGVQKFTVLLSPDMIDFAKPVQVTVNGKTAFEGLVKKDVATLVTWAARDNDRSMLYGAGLTITVP
jgi:dienelactone hydrolase